MHFRVPTAALRGFIVLELAGVAYLITFAVLNAPAYAEQVRFAANGRDLSSTLVGRYVPIEEVPEQGSFPYVQVTLAGSQPAATTAQTPDAPSTQAAGTVPVAPAKPVIPTIDPDAFVPNSVTVPRIGVRAPLVEVSNNAEKTQQDGLARGVIHIYGTPLAGQPGNAFYAGHSSDFLLKKGSYKTVFALLPELRKGDYFIITDATSMRYFRVVETVITGPNDTSVLQRGGPDQAFASLQTSYPVGTASKRFVAVGALERTIDVSQ